MWTSFKQPRIIGALLLAATLVLSGCAVVRLTYNQGPQWVAWWLDGYADLDDVQAPRARSAIDGWFAWHRRTQLPDYAELLARMQAQVMAPTTPAAVCAWQDDITQRVETAVNQAVPPLADLAVTITPAQIVHLEKRYAKNNEEFRSDYLQPDKQERQNEALKRTLDRAEMLYGRFDETQREQLVRGLAASPFDPELWLAERRARQQDVLQTLRSLNGDGRPGTTEARAAMQGVADRWARSPRPAYAAYQQRLKDYNCMFGAQVHNNTSPKQRQYARDKLKGWEDDARALSAAK